MNSYNIIIETVIKDGSFESQTVVFKDHNYQKASDYLLKIKNKYVNIKNSIPDIFKSNIIYNKNKATLIVKQKERSIYYSISEVIQNDKWC